MRHHLLIILSFLTGLAFAEPAYTVARTEVHALPAKALQRHYQLFVSLPASCAARRSRRS